MVGQRLISKDSDNKDDKDDDDDDDDGIFDSLKDKFDDVKDSVVDEVDDLVGDAVDGVANAIGISDWYSIHIMDTCEGNFKPNATAPSPSLNITNCTSPEIKRE